MPEAISLCFEILDLPQETGPFFKSSFYPGTVPVL
jgi:hypothetical protein